MYLSQIFKLYLVFRLTFTVNISNTRKIREGNEVMQYVEFLFQKLENSTDVVNV